MATRNPNDLAERPVDGRGRQGDLQIDWSRIPMAPAHAPVTNRVATEAVSGFYGDFAGVKDVTLGFQSNQVHALIGPSGCGKSTFLRVLNRMHEVVGGQVEG